MIYLMEMFFKRVEKAWRDFKADVGNRTVLLVSHSGVMEAVLCIETGFNIPIGKGSMKSQKLRFSASEEGREA